MLEFGAPDARNPLLTAASALRRTQYHLHFVLASLVGGIAFTLISIVGILYFALTRDRRSPMLFARTFAAVMRGVTGWRIEAEGLERMNRMRPSVMMARHQSNLDIVTFGTIYPNGTVVLGKLEIKKIPFFGWFFGATGNIFVDRKNPRRAIASLQEAAERVKREKLSVWVFPEGTRNSSRSLRPFKKGAFHLAIAAQIPILPIVSGPVDTVLDGDRWMVRPGKLALKVLPEIPSAGMTDADVDLLVGRVWKAMDEGQKALLETAAPPIGGAQTPPTN